jgi:hypothetical protein
MAGNIDEALERLEAEFAALSDDAIRREIAEAQERAAYYTRKLDRLRLIELWRKSLSVESAERVETPALRNDGVRRRKTGAKAAIVALFKARPDAVLAPKDVRDLLEIDVSLEVIRTTLRRLRDEGFLLRLDDGGYRLAQPSLGGGP